MPSLLTLSDVLGTGHHAAVVAGVKPGRSVAVVGDGAVGLCGVIAAKRLGAEQIIIMGRHADRTRWRASWAPPTWSPSAARRRSQRDPGAHRRLRRPRRVLECVGTEQAMETVGGDGPARRRGRARRRPALRRRSRWRSRRSTRTSRSAAARPRCARTSRSCCPTCSRARSSPAGSSTAPSASTGCRTATGRWPTASRSRSWFSRDPRRPGRPTSSTGSAPRRSWRSLRGGPMAGRDGRADLGRSRRRGPVRAVVAGDAGAWYRAVQAPARRPHPRGRHRARRRGCRRRRALNEAVDAAYREKYGANRATWRRWSSEQARATTLKLACRRAARMSRGVTASRSDVVVRSRRRARWWRSSPRRRARSRCTSSTAGPMGSATRTCR